MANLCIFGGSFDPVHRGHLAIAREAADRFKLKEVHFVVAAVSPFKVGETQTSYLDRYAMVALGCAEDRRFLPSSLEYNPQGTAVFTVDTVRRFRERLGKNDRLFFLCGMDAFAGIARWRDPETLLHSCEFIVAARPGFSLAQIGAALPEAMRPSESVLKASKGEKLGKTTRELIVHGATIHLLPDTNEKASSTSVREAIEKRRSLSRFVDPAVTEYIKKRGLYLPQSKQSAAESSRATLVEKHPKPKGKLLRMPGPAPQHRMKDQ